VACDRFHARDGRPDRPRARRGDLIETYSRELPIVRLLHLFQFVRLTQSACLIFFPASEFGPGTLKFSMQGIQVHPSGRLSLGNAGREKTGTR